MIDFDVIFPMQSSEVTKSLNFESISRKKTAYENLKFIFNFSPDLIFTSRKTFSEFVMGYIPMDLSQIFPMKPSEFKIPISVESYYDKTAKNYQYGYVGEKRIISKLLKVSIPKFQQHNLKNSVKIVSNFQVPIFYTFGEISRQTALRLGRVELVHCFK